MEKSKLLKLIESMPDGLDIEVQYEGDDSGESEILDGGECFSITDIVVDNGSIAIKI